MANTGGRRRRGSHAFRSQVGKRSFKRALARAKLEGQTFYRGRVLYPTMCYAPAPRVQANTQQARVQVFSWNAGGLSAEANAELEYFLQTSSYAIALVQETHWSTSGEWAKGDWTFIHSASQRPRQDGVMVAIRTSLLTTEEVQWQEIVPGRLLRVRAALNQQQWDIFSLYQHAGNAVGREKLLAKRRTVWRKLDVAIQGTPHRSMILLGGDFNASLLPHSPHVGHGVLAGSAGIDLEQERHALNELFCRHRLTVLNSWGRRQATYEHPTGNSQIDFLVVRQQVADGISKKAGPTSSGLAEWRKAGHRLVSGSLRAEWRPWKRMPGQQPRGPVLQKLDSREEPVVALRALVKARCPGRTMRPVLPPRDGVSLEIECH